MAVCALPEHSLIQFSNCCHRPTIVSLHLCKEYLNVVKYMQHINLDDKHFDT